MAIHVRSSFSNREGTWVSDALAAQREGNGMDQPIITGVAHDRSEATVTVSGIPDKVGGAAQLVRVVARSGINIDMIVQSTSRSTGQADMAFRLPSRDGQVAMAALRGVQGVLGLAALDFADGSGER